MRSLIALRTLVSVTSLVCVASAVHALGQGCPNPFNAFDTGFSWGDNAIAVGRTRVLVGEFNLFASYDSCGIKYGPDEWYDGANSNPKFFGGLVPNHPTLPVAIVDPEVHFDPSNSADKRFWVMGHTVDQSVEGGPVGFYIGHASDPDAAVNWTRAFCDYSAAFPAKTTTFFDSGNMSVDSSWIWLDAYALGYDGSGTLDEHAVARVDKAGLLQTPPVLDVRWANTAQWVGIEPALAVRYSFNDGTPQYAVGAANTPGPSQPISSITLYALRVDSGTNIVTPIPSTVLNFPSTVPPFYRAPVSIPQPNKPNGSAGPPVMLVSGNTRIWNAVYRNGSVWAVHTVGDGPNATRSLIRWYEIQMNAWEGSGAPGVPTIRQWGVIDPAARFSISDLSGFVPAIAVDQSNNAAVSFNTVAPSPGQDTPDNTRFVAIRRVSRCADDGLNQMPVATTLYQSNTVLDTGAQSVGGGDFSGLVPDFTVANRFFCHSWAPQANSTSPTFPNRAITRVIRFDGECGLDAD